MRMCERHWGKLREEVGKRGLNHLLAGSGEEAAKRLAAGGFEPLIDAHNSVVANAMNVAGKALMVADMGVQVCPLCYLVEQCQCGKGDCKAEYELWPEKAADDALAHAMELKLLLVS